MVERVFQFDVFTLDIDRRILHAFGSEVALEPKVFDCLAYLVLQRGRAIGRDELIAAVWGKADVSDAMLGQAVLKARRAVGDDGAQQLLIRTVSRFGYQWIAETRRPSSPVAPTLRRADDEPPMRQRNLMAPAGLGFAAAALVMVWAALTAA